jgi:hypothetical protein
LFYEPVQTERFFDRNRKYAEINWAYFPGIVDAFEQRIHGWYIDPIEFLLEKGQSQRVRNIVRCLTGRDEAGHYSFTVAAMSCLLIDTLSQYNFGILESNPDKFKDFVRENLSNYNMPLRPPIAGYRPSGRHVVLSDIADVLYHGFRCGILHQAHAPLYCGIVPGDSPPKVESINHAKYSRGATHSDPGMDCPVVVICPEHLFNEVMTFFTSYLNRLKDKSDENDLLRDNFKMKFTDSFGVDISSATL